MDIEKLKEAVQKTSWAIHQKEKIDSRKATVDLAILQTLATLADQVLSAEMPEKKELVSAQTSCDVDRELHHFNLKASSYNEALDQCRLWNAKRR